MMSVNFNTDPTVIGPGCWYALHTASWKARTDEQIDAFIQFFKEIIERFPCGDCHKHAKEYFRTNNIEENRNQTYEFASTELSNGIPKERIGIFIYIVDFHNAVNRRLGKPQVARKDAYNAYLNDSTGTCAIGCEEKSLNKEGKNNNSESLSNGGNVSVTKGQIATLLERRSRVKRRWN